ANCIVFFIGESPVLLTFPQYGAIKKAPLREPLRDELFSTDIRLIGFLEFHNYFLSYLDA
ncbi:hypothetical protein MJM86_23995, partial [Salmonella enterica subsp. enterica serovar Kentucky]|nr:hypothetical protein [Salmonella enterica subsp. enterica serovar Kentucky]